MTVLPSLKIALVLLTAGATLARSGIDLFKLEESRQRHPFMAYSFMDWCREKSLSECLPNG